MAGATPPPITPVVADGVIAVNLRVLMEPTRVALWDTHATIQTRVKTVRGCLNHLRINLKHEQNTYKQPKYT